MIAKPVSMQATLDINGNKRAAERNFSLQAEIDYSELNVCPSDQRQAIHPLSVNQPQLMRCIQLIPGASIIKGIRCVLHAVVSPLAARVKPQKSPENVVVDSANQQKLTSLLLNEADHYIASETDVRDTNNESDKGYECKELLPLQYQYYGNRLDKNDPTNHDSMHTIITAYKGDRYELLNSFESKELSPLVDLLEQLNPIVRAKKIVKKDMDWVSREKVVIGKGGFGKVRLARNSAGELVAVKKMNVPDRANTEIAAFKLIPKSERFAQVYDFAIVPGKKASQNRKAYYFQELVVGEELSSYLENTNPAEFKSDLKLNWAYDACLAFNELHDSGCYVFDGKTSNFRIYRNENREQRLKMVDLDTIRNEEFAKGKTYTYTYCPPEGTAAGGKVMDSYALGVILWEIDNQCHPLQSEGLSSQANSDESKAKYLYEDLPMLSSSERNQAKADIARLRAVNRLLDNPDFVRKCGNAKQEPISISTIALLLLHPDPVERISVKEAKSLLNFMLESGDRYEFCDTPSYLDIHKLKKYSM